MEKLFMKCVLFFTWFLHGGSALREVQIVVPAAVRVGDAVTLTCRWSLEAGETLYSVKWYKGRQEFYRYIPKELPHTRVFPHPAINVDVSRSNERQVALRGASRALAGRFRCEVSADAPSFHTEVRSAYMHIVELPESAPIISAEKGWYATGDRLRARCSASPADPPANLTWLLNGREVQGVPIQYEMNPSLKPVETALAPPSSATPAPTSLDSDTNSLIFAPWADQGAQTDIEYTKELGPRADATRSRSQLAELHISTPRSEETDDGIPDIGPEVSNKLPSASRLSFTVQTDSFERGRLSLTCISSVHSVYSARAELVIEEERPQIASVLGTRESNSGTADRPSLLMVAATVLPILLSLRKWIR